MPKRSKTIVILNKKSSQSTPAGPTVYGSRRASQFLKDLASNADSLDVVILGDSNTGSALSGGWGWLAGIQQSLSNLGAPCYGTPLCPFVDRSNSGQARFYGNWRGSMATIATSASYLSGLTASTVSPTVADAVPYTAWNAASVRCSYGAYNPQGTLSGVTITGTAGQFACTSTKLQVGQQVQITGTFSGSGSISGYTSGVFYHIIATNGNTTFQLSATAGGTPLTTTAGTPTGLTYTSTADFDDWVYIPSSATGLFISGGSGISIQEHHPLAANGVVQFLRVRYGKVATAEGRFIPNVYANGAANGLTRLINGGAGISGAVSMTLGAGETSPTFNMHEVQFTANGKGHSAHAIGYNSSGTEFSQGPGALFCQSVYRKSKGFAVHSHAYQSGANTTEISNVISSTANSNISLLLREIRERQIAAGGSGRVLLWVHSGVNGADTTTTWTNGHKAIWEKYKTVWSSLGYPASDLAVVSIVTPPQNSNDTSGSGATLADVRTAANSMAIDNSDMCVVDVKKLMSYSALVEGTGNASYYQRFANTPNIGSDISFHLSGGTVTTTSQETATVTTANSITLTGTTAVTVDGYWNGSLLEIQQVNGVTDPPAFQQALITQYNGATKVATVAQWTGGQPTNGVSILYKIARKYPSDGYSVVSQAVLTSLLST